MREASESAAVETRGGASESARARERASRWKWKKEMDGARESEAGGTELYHLLIALW